jgi:cell division protein FtsN
MKTLNVAGKGGKSVKQQAGGFVMGLVAGLLIGLAVALGVALYITKAPSLFLNKVPQRTAEQDTAETERNRNWDPNAPLSGKAGNHAAAASGAVTAAPAAASATPEPASPAATMAATTPAAPPAAASAPATAAATAAKPPAKDPVAILNGGATAAPRDPYIYFVQTGAYTRNDDAEQQKAKLALIGQTARITEREQAGRTVYRVRLGPFPSRDEADVLQTQLQEQTIEAQIVRVEKP